MNSFEKATIGAYIVQDFRISILFSKYEIDFFSEVSRTLSEVCSAKSLDGISIENEINAILSSKSSSEIDFKSYSPSQLVDYILERHHLYVEERVPILFVYLDKLYRMYGQKHPELAEINNLFKISGGELLNHLKKEEIILFPFIKQMSDALKNKETIEQPQFGSVDNPIATLEHDHEVESNLVAKISDLTNNYIPPLDACELYIVTFALLKDFEQDLNKHIYLENNILFQKAKELEECFLIAE